jgi:hypothetical protein
MWVRDMGCYTSYKELLKHDSLIVGWIRNNFFTQLTRKTFNKIAQSLQLSDAADCNGQGPKVIAPLRLVWIHGPAFFVLTTSAIFELVTRVTSGRGTGSSSPWPGHLRFASHNFLRNRRTFSFHHSKQRKSQSSIALAAKVPEQKRECQRMKRANEVKNPDHRALLYIASGKKMASITMSHPARAQ